MATSVITSPTYDPIPTATQQATNATAAQKAILAAQNTKAKAQQDALATLSTAMSAFQTTLSSLSNATTSVAANSATVSNTAVASATASNTAASGSYSFYVQQLATAGQVSYGGITDSAAAGSGSLNVVLADGSNFQVDLANADKDGSGQLSAKEIAAAINVAADNDSRATASTLTVNGVATLVLTSGKTGAANSVTLNTDNLTNAALKAQLDDSSNVKQQVVAKDAILWVGDKTTGTQVTQASNVFTVVDDVKLTVTKAQAADDAPITLTVGKDATATTANVQAFVDAYNKLDAVLGTVAARGDPNKGTSDGPLANDSAVASVRANMATLLRKLSGGQTLVNFGITGKRDGTLELDSTRLGKALAAAPASLDRLFGSTTGNTGVLGSLNKLMTVWTSATGQLSSRTAGVTKELDKISDRQDVLAAQYKSSYDRFLKQFTTLQDLQSRMTTNSNLFTAMFSSSSS